MITYFLNMILMATWAILLLWQKPSAMKRMMFCVIVSIQWVLLSGLRHFSVGDDTLAYKLYRFDPVLGISWAEAMRIVGAAFAGHYTVKDPGYVVFVKAAQLITHDYQVFLIIVALCFTVPLGLFIFRYSSEPLMSFLIYACLFASFFAITGLRQTVATALIVLVGYRFVEQRRPLPFIVLVAAAFMIHKSAIVFAPFYFVGSWKLTAKRASFMLAAVPLIYVFRTQVMRIVGTALGYEQYTLQFAGAGAWVFSAMLLLVVVVSLWRAPAVLAQRPEATAWHYAAMIALALTPLTFVDPNAMRVVQYFSLFLILLVPEVIRSFAESHERAIAYLVAASSLLFLFSRGDLHYLFFWQGA
ncbi:EpsG family protein [bacterium]|nr:EpsG family protein [bacterium]